jgi:hypothetical protein
LGGPSLLLEGKTPRRGTINSSVTRSNVSFAVYRAVRTLLEPPF